MWPEMNCRTFDPSNNASKMKAGSKFQDGSQFFHLATGEMAMVEKGECGRWGFTTNTGRNSWEGNDGWATKKAAVEELREREKIWVLNAKYDEQ